MLQHNWQLIPSRWFCLATCLASLLLLWAGDGSTAIAQQIDPKLPDYKKVSGVSGTLKSVGSDTMNNLVSLWAGEFKKMYPGVKTEIDGKGSSNAIPALVAGTATFGPMSRDAKGSELSSFEAKFGYKPLLLPTSIDMLAVYVHRNNPLESLTFAQIDSIFSSTRKQGSKEQSKTWGQLGATGEAANKSITCYGRNAASGTYGYFKEKVLGDGDYGVWVSELPGSSAVVQAVGENPFGIGYSGIGYSTANVKPLAIDNGNNKIVKAEAAAAMDGTYPLARFLYIAVNHDSRKKLDPLRAEFLRFIFSKQGQTQVVKDGYLPVTAITARKALSSVGLQPGF
ncbi:MAG: phosphate ABC transporter substrate-binding protein [Pirellulaceae bacterium]|nr:phosphate ABC transporter substrate-binding protein [Pirellulaceae bacterium]